MALFFHLKPIPQADREAPRAAGIHYFEPCDGWAGEQAMVCSHFCISSSPDPSFLLVFTVSFHTVPGS